MGRITDEELIALYEKLGSVSAVVLETGIDRRGIQRRLKRLRLRGYSPEHDMRHTVPEGFTVAGASTLYKPDGTIALQWVKSRQDREVAHELMRGIIADMAKDLPREKPVKAPTACDDDLLNQYTITDFHLGMLAWGEETGADWDLKIAEDMIIKWFAIAIAAAPAAKYAVFAQLGDFMHWDGMLALTPESKHVLDADTRFQKLVRVAIRIHRRIVAMLLQKHEIIYLTIAEGNHDPASSIFMRELFHDKYEDEPRVIVDVSPDPYYCIEHGLVALFYHHGHKRNVKNVDTVFAAKFREIFGRTKYAYAHTGHLHSVDVKETNLMIVEQHRTLAAPDAYASRGGWMSGRDAKVITYHKRRGEWSRITINSNMVEESK